MTRLVLQGSSRLIAWTSKATQWLVLRKDVSHILSKQGFPTTCIVPIPIHDRSDWYLLDIGSLAKLSKQFGETCC